MYDHRLKIDFNPFNIFHIDPNFNYTDVGVSNLITLLALT